MTLKQVREPDDRNNAKADGCPYKEEPFRHSVLDIVTCGVDRGGAHLMRQNKATNMAHHDKPPEDGFTRLGC